MSGRRRSSKELVENSIDAKAASVTVEIQDGGISLIRVTDNGSGIEREDIRNAFLRHSTSKIRKVEDLAHIASLGFRGEARFQYLCGDQDGADHQDEEDTFGTRYVIEAEWSRVWRMPGHRTGRPSLCGSCFIMCLPDGSF